MTFYVSQSKANDWQLCRRKFHYRHREHLKPRAPPRPLKFGAIAHELLDADARGKDMRKQLTVIAKRDPRFAQSEEGAQLLDDISYISRAYKQFWSLQPLHFKEIKRKQRTPLKMIEVPFEVELTQDISAKGRIDGIVHEKQSDWVLEHKTHNTFPNADHRWRNTQSAVYMRIVEMLGWANPAGMLWDYTRNKSPTKPKLLASGKISLAEIESLPEVIVDTATLYIEQGHKQVALQEQGINELAEQQRANLHTWFQRVYTPVQPAVVKSLFADFVATAREMHDYYEKNDTTPPRKSIGLHCSWCPFEPLCRAELQRRDDDDDSYDYVREAQFVVDTSEYQTEIVE
jgi:hypothetical protein